jgi:hypothetical protein
MLRGELDVDEDVRLGVDDVRRGETADVSPRVCGASQRQDAFVTGVVGAGAGVSAG